MIRVLLALLAATLLLAGVQTWRVERLKPQLTEANRLLASYRTAYRTAKTDAQTEANQCAARVSDARASAQRIETIIERPVHVDPQGCAVRDLIGADELRNALQP